MAKEKLGAQIRLLRQARDMSLRQVEAETGISNPYLSQLENGKIKNPSAQTLTKLANCYDIGVNDLMIAAGYVLECKSNKKQTSSLPKTALGKINDLTDEEVTDVLNYIEFLRQKRSK